MSKRREGYGLAAVAVLSLVIVPLDFACVIFTSETTMWRTQHDSYVRMTHAIQGLGWLFLVLQIVAGWLLAGC
jgi:hypothetical protein